MTDLKTNPLWQRVIEGMIHPELLDAAQQEFLTRSANRVGVLREAMRTFGIHGHAALRLLRQVTIDEQEQAFPELIQAARYANGPIGYVRDLILALPRTTWVLAHIDALVEPILAGEEYDDYWVFLELYEQLDPERAMKLARRAIAHADPEIREVGELAMERLTSPALS